MLDAVTPWVIDESVDRGIDNLAYVWEKTERIPTFLMGPTRIPTETTQRVNSVFDPTVFFFWFKFGFDFNRISVFLHKLKYECTTYILITEVQILYLQLPTELTLIT